MIPKSTAYKLVLNNVIVNEGSKSAMIRAKRAHLKAGVGHSFIGLSPSKKIGDQWENPVLYTENHVNP